MATNSRTKRRDRDDDRPAIWVGYGKSVKLFREEAGLTQQQLADAVGYSCDQVASIEQARRPAKAQFTQAAEEVSGAGGALPVPVAQCGEGEHQCGEPLLPVDDEPAPHSPCRDPAGRQHDRAQEVGGRGAALQPLLDQFLYVVPQLPQLIVLPVVGPLVQRNLELLLALNVVSWACTRAFPPGIRNRTPICPSPPPEAAVQDFPGFHPYPRFTTAPRRAHDNGSHSKEERTA